MNKRIKKLWIRMLRSGKYKQTQQALKNKNGHCCLGVLCEIHAKETGEKWTRRSSGSYSYLGRPGLLTGQVMRWAGLEGSESIRIKSSKYKSLACANDKGRSFKQIANLIEHRL